MSVIYKEREREREWDSSSRSGGQGYTTVRRYKVPDHSLEEDTYESEMRIVHRGGRSDIDDRRSTRDYVERDDREVREYRYAERSPSPQRREVRDYQIRRRVERSPSPATVREIRIERDYEREAPQREDQYSLEKYSRDIEYFREPQQQQQQQQAPQPIYIRNEAPQPMQMQPIIIREEAPQPIIIRERVEPAYELIERSEVQQERQVARPRYEDDYYYERKIKEVDRGGRHEERYSNEREYGHDRHGDRNYYSDDDAIYIHKEKDTWGGGSESHVKRDVAAGALAGIAAGQIVRHHRKRKGETAGGNIGNALGYGTLGAVGAVALDKFNNRDRSRSRSRSASAERGRDRRGSHGRGRSKSRVREIGALAAIAGVGALAYAAGRKNKNKETVVVKEHRSKSRHRRSRSRRGRSKSVTVVESDGGRSRSTSKHRDPKHRSNRAAQVGLASAAVAGLAARSRSKSRKREGKREHSRIREGVPIAAAGVVGAAVTGLYEKRKAKKETRALSRSRSRSRSKSRSRSVLSRLTGRSRSRRGSTVSEPVLVEYGGDPIYTDRRAESKSRGRKRRGSSSSSDGRRHGSRSRSRSKSRARSVAEGAAVAGVAGLAAHEAAKRRERKKAEKEREKRREDDSAYSTGSYSPYDSPRPSTAHPNDSRYFPETNYFPPPPNATVDPNAAYPPYNPADYPPPSSNYEPGHPAGFVNPPHEDMHPGNPYAQPPQQHHDPYYGQPRHPDDNVSAPVPVPEHVFASARGGSRALPAQMPSMANNEADRLDESDSPSPPPGQEKSVKFDLHPRGPSREVSPDKADGDDAGHRRRRKDDERSDSTKESGRHRKRRHRDEGSGEDSDATIELPPRFDERGRSKDPAADKLESVLMGLFR